MPLQNVTDAVLFVTTQSRPDHDPDNGFWLNHSRFLTSDEALCLGIVIGLHTICIPDKWSVPSFRSWGEAYATEPCCSSREWRCEQNRGLCSRRSCIQNVGPARGMSPSTHREFDSHESKDIKRRFKTILDLGSGPGHFTKLLDPTSTSTSIMLDSSSALDFFVS